MGFRTRWWQACQIQNLGSEIKESHCFDTHLNFRRGFAGIRMKISVRRSWSLAIISAEDKETRFISKNFSFLITNTEFGVNFVLSNKVKSFSYKDSNFNINPDPRKQ